MDRDVVWEMEHGEPDTPTSEGSYYAEAWTKYTIDNFGGMVLLRLVIESPTGGLLLFQVQAPIQAPFDDVVIKVDRVTTSIIMDAIEEWTTQELDIEGGHHVVQWVHRKNPSDASEEGLAMGHTNLGITRIDDLMLLPY